MRLLLPSIALSSIRPSSFTTAMQDSGKGKGSPGIAFAAAAAALQLRLLEAYLALPDASAFTMEHAAAPPAMHPRKSDEYAGTSLHLQYSLPLFKSLESKLLGQYPYWQLIQSDTQVVLP